MAEKESPKNLDECLNFLINGSSEEDLKGFAETPEGEAGAKVHSWGGMGLRNAWNLWDDTSPLARWFHTIKICHADDMSGIIFDSLHRKLNNKPIDLDGQVKKYHDHWMKLYGKSPEDMLKKVQTL